MNVTEADRLELHQAIRGVIGVRPADIFMECIIPRDWDDLVRVDQLNAFRAEMRAEFAELQTEFADLRAEVRGDVAGLRTEFADLRAGFTELRAHVDGEIAALRAEMRQGFTELRMEFRTQLQMSLRRQTQFMLGFMGTLTVSMIIALVR